MAFGTFSSPGLPAGTMVGTQAPQKLFGDIPAATAQIPGMVTPNITAAMPSYVDWDAVNTALQAQQTQRRATWGAARPVQQAPRPNLDEERQKLRAAFDEMYGPQVQNSYNDQMVNLEGTRTAQGTLVPKRYGTSTHAPNMYSSNMTAADWNRGLGPGATNPGADKGYLPAYKLPENEVRRRLDSMWRMRTDPYMKAAMTMGISGMG